MHIQSPAERRRIKLAQLVESEGYDTLEEQAGRHEAYREAPGCRQTRTRMAEGPQG